MSPRNADAFINPSGISRTRIASSVPKNPRATLIRRTLPFHRTSASEKNSKNKNVSAVSKKTTESSESSATKNTKNSEIIRTM